jgi:hypothetical protein
MEEETYLCERCGRYTWTGDLATVPRGFYCQECSGFGLLTCDCGHEHECRECHGTGEDPLANKEDFLNLGTWEKPRWVAKSLCRFCAQEENTPALPLELDAAMCA